MLLNSKIRILQNWKHRIYLASPLFAWPSAIISGQTRSIRRISYVALKLVRRYSPPAGKSATELRKDILAFAVKIPCLLIIENHFVVIGKMDGRPVTVGISARDSSSKFIRFFTYFQLIPENSASKITLPWFFPSTASMYSLSGQVAREWSEGLALHWATSLWAVYQCNGILAIIIWLQAYLNCNGSNLEALLPYSSGLKLYLREANERIKRVSLK